MLQKKEKNFVPTEKKAKTPPGFKAGGDPIK
jgi:hypothetical protein